jgi:NAD(P)-dependent dehydrogenase (short-subunit alcohol dehydrogenase family)
MWKYHIFLNFGRDRKKGQDALEALKKETGSEKIELKIVDLSIPSQIHDFASEFLKTGNRLVNKHYSSFSILQDVLINSAGVLLHKRTETSDGIEVTFATHVLGSFLLTEYLLPVRFFFLKKVIFLKISRYYKRVHLLELSLSLLVECILLR